MIKMNLKRWIKLMTIRQSQQGQLYNRWCSLKKMIQMIQTSMEINNKNKITVDHTHNFTSQTNRVKIGKRADTQWPKDKESRKHQMILPVKMIQLICT